MTPFSRSFTSPQVRTTTWPGNTPPAVVVTPTLSINENLSCAGIVKGNHKTPNAWNFSYSKRRLSVGKETQRSSSFTVTYEGPNIGPAPVSGFDLNPVSSPYNKALGKLYDNIRGNVDLSIDLAEVGKTTSMIRSAASQMLGLATSWRRGLLSGGKHAADTYLQWKYGVRPLMETMYELSSKQLLVAIEPVTFQSRAQYNNSRQLRTKNYLGTYVTVVDNVECSRRCLVSLTFSQSSTSISTLSQYTSLNPLSIAWELTPYSFVADWFVDIGGYLRMAETALLSGLQFHSGFRTDSYRSFATRINSGAKYEYGTTYTLSSTGNYEDKGMSRVILSGMPFPELPRINLDLGSSRLLSAAALLSQFVKLR